MNSSEILPTTFSSRIPSVERIYDITFGENLLAEAGTLLCSPSFRSSQILNKVSVCAIITDHHVANLYLPILKKSFEPMGWRLVEMLLPPGESSKSYPYYVEISEKLLKEGLSRQDLIIALGGGIVGDLAGFIAATLLRGIEYVQIPTSLLAQVDSSIGGKTGINSHWGKNLVGAFHLPCAVLCDFALLDTLPERHFRSGYAELVKYALIQDASFFEWLETHRQAIFIGGPFRQEAVMRACKMKAKIVEEDFYEQNKRALLNLGHTFAHAFESSVEYKEDILLHGEAVSVGLMCALRFSCQENLFSPSDVQRVEVHLQDAKLPTRLYHIPPFASLTEKKRLDMAKLLVEFMLKDKKNRNGKISLILAQAIGKAFLQRDVRAEQVLAFITQELVSQESESY